MFNTFRILAMLLYLFLAAERAAAYVVIDILDSGAEASDASASDVNSVNDRATGTVEGDSSEDLSGDEDLLFPTAATGVTANGQNRRSASPRLRQLNRNRSRRGGGIGGGGGGGGGFGGQGRRVELLQPAAPGDDTDEPIGQEEPVDDGTDLTTFEPNQPSNGLGGGGGAGALSLDPDSPADSDAASTGPSGSGPRPGKTVSGTPEPAALVVWAVAGCCGYGLVRFGKKKAIKE